MICEMPEVMHVLVCECMCESACKSEIEKEREKVRERWREVELRKDVIPFF